jgi:hypothetical protein
MASSAAAHAIRRVRHRCRVPCWVFTGLRKHFKNYGQQSVNMAAEAEQTHLAFEVMLKSGEKAADMLRDIRKFAAETPFNNAELTDSSRKLLAYGLAADQVIPTLRMLGDVAAGTQTPISDLTYLYGTLYAQQRAYTIDIMQFARRGIPIYEELAKVLGKSVPEMKELVEEAKVGRAEITKTFLAMTTGNGLYAGLTGRQADTFAGVREQLTDALQVGKIKVGKILIEELGLKEAAKDLTHFVESAESGMDRIRPFVRFMGELGRSVAQVGYESAKAWANGLSLWARMGDAAFPDLGKALADLRAFIKEGKDFKLNPLAVNDTFFKVSDGLMQFFIDTLRGIRDIGEALRREIVLPLAKGFDDFFREFYGKKATLGLQTKEERFRPPSQFEPDTEIVRRYRDLDNEIVMTMRNFGLDEQARPMAMNPQMAGRYTQNPRAYQKEFLDEFLPLVQARNKFGAAFEGQKDWVGPHHGKLLVEGVVPPMRAREDVALGDKGFLSRTIGGLEGQQREMRRVYDETRAQLTAELLQRQREQREAEHAIDMTRQANNAFAGLASGAGLAAKELMTVKAPEGPTIPWQIPGDVTDAAKHTKENFGDPLKKFVEEYSALTGAMAAELIDVEEYQRARNDLVARTNVKLGGPSQLPEAAVRGSAEDVRILNQFQSGNNQQTVEQLLQMANEKLEKLVQSNSEIERKTDRINPFRIGQ